MKVLKITALFCWMNIIVCTNECIIFQIPYQLHIECLALETNGKSCLKDFEEELRDGITMPEDYMLRFQKPGDTKALDYSTPIGELPEELEVLRITQDMHLTLEQLEKIGYRTPEERLPLDFRHWIENLLSLEWKGHETRSEAFTLTDYRQSFYIGEVELVIEGDMIKCKNGRELAQILPVPEGGPVVLLPRMSVSKWFA
jgi:hypothetical protein